MYLDELKKPTQMPTTHAIHCNIPSNDMLYTHSHTCLHTHIFPAAIHCDCVPGWADGEGDGQAVRGLDLHSHFQPGDLHPGHLGHIITAIFCLFIPSFTGLRVTDLHTSISTEHIHTQGCKFDSM